MPTSTYSQIPTLVSYLHTLMPTSILDVGLGNGKLGFIARDYLDVMLGERYRRSDWKIRIDGIEAFPDYVQDYQRAIYDDIHLGDAYDVIDGLGSYDVVFLGDVLEHFEKPRAEAFLDKCCAHVKQAIILSIPLGERWTQEDIYGNPYERHRSFWTSEELEPRASAVNLLDFPGLGKYGTFLIRREDYRHHQARRHAETLVADGKRPAAIAALETAIDELQPNLQTVVLLAELLVSEGALEAALQWLRLGERHFPEAPLLPSSIAQLTALVPVSASAIHKAV